MEAKWRKGEEEEFDSDNDASPRSQQPSSSGTARNGSSSSGSGSGGGGGSGSGGSSFEGRAALYAWASEQFKSLRQDMTVQHIKCTGARASTLPLHVYETHARMALEHGDLNE